MRVKNESSFTRLQKVRKARRLAMCCRVDATATDGGIRILCQLIEVERDNSANFEIP